MTVKAAVATDVIWTALGLGIAYLAHDLGIGVLSEPGPGLLAFACGIAMAMLGFAGAAHTAWSARRRPAANPKAAASRSAPVLAHPPASPPGLTRGAIRFATSVLPRRWIAGSSPAMTGNNIDLPWPMIGIFAALIAYIAALQPIGFLLATFAFLLVLLLASAAVSRIAALVIAATVAVSAHVLFKFGLGVQLPAGLLG